MIYFKKFVVLVVICSVITGAMLPAFGMESAKGSKNSNSAGPRSVPKGKELRKEESQRNIQASKQFGKQVQSQKRLSKAERERQAWFRFQKQKEQKRKVESRRLQEQELMDSLLQNWENLVSSSQARINQLRANRRGAVQESVQSLAPVASAASVYSSVTAPTVQKAQLPSNPMFNIWESMHWLRFPAQYLDHPASQCLAPMFDPRTYPDLNGSDNSLFAFH